MKLKIFLLLLCITSIKCVEQSNTKISSARNPYRQAVCSYYSTFFNESQKSSTQPLISAYSYLSDQNIEKIIFNQQYLQLPTETILMVMPHIVALVVLVLIWPGLCCCCMCPDRHPACKKCRKQPKQMYGKCQLKWPTFATLFAYLIILIGAAAALYDGPNISNYINNYGCRLLAISDDTLYGRVSHSNSDVFYVGLVPFSQELTTFKSRIGTFFSQSNNSLNTSSSIRSKQTGIQSQISSQYLSYNNIQYNNAFRQSDGVTYIPIDSAFKTMHYGPVNDSTKILGNINSQLNTLFSQVNIALDPMITAWSYLEGLGSSTVSSYIDTTITNINANEVSINATIEYYKGYDIPQTFTWINFGFKLLYGLVAAVSALGLIATIVLTCCTVVRIRYIIYITCGLLIFIGIATFALTIILSYALPNAAQICAYGDRKLATSQGIYQFLYKMKFNQSAALFKNCIDGGDGNMLPNLSPTFQQAFKSIDLIADSTLQFNSLIPNFNSDNFNKPFTQASAVITNVKQVKIFEISNTNALNFLQGVARKSYTVHPTDCTNAANVNADSWVPSTSVISCQGGTFKQNPCLDLSNVVVCPQGCYGMYEQLTSPAGDPSSYTTNLYTRYGSNCNYATYIINLHSNWNLIRKNEMDSVQADLNTIKSSVNDYDTSVKAIQAGLSSFKSNLETNFNSQTNLVTGTFNGFDCSVLGETLVQYRDSACVGVLSSIQFNLIMTAIISYGILLLTCFSVCAGVRHFQHLQKMQTQVGYKGVPIAVSSKRIIDSFSDD